MKIETICLDMDGVLAGFVHQLFNLYGINPVPIEEVIGWNHLSIVLSRHLDRKVTDEEIWQRVAERGTRFWSTIPLLPWARDVFALCKDTGCEVLLMSSPGSGKAAATATAGKVEWIQREFPDADGYCITPQKWKFAQKGWLLIDDNEDWCNAFRKKGQAFCFPRPWNTRNYHDPLGDLRKFLSQ